MSTKLDLYLDLTFPNIRDLWMFVHTTKFHKKQRDELLKKSHCSEVELMASAIRIFNERVKKLQLAVEDLHPSLDRRAKRLALLPKNTIQFVDEFENLEDSANLFKINRRKVGEHKAVNYMIDNRIKYLLDKFRMHQHMVGYVINRFNGREDDGFMKNMYKIQCIIEDEFQIKNWLW